MDIWVSSVTGNPQNRLYENRIEIQGLANLALACKYDYTAAKFKDGIRSNKNFIQADVVIMDIDNSHSDDPDEWVTPEDVMKAFPDVRFAVHYSRNHMKEKDGKAARPKFHVIFFIEPITDAQLYTELKRLLAELFPYFDNNALDAARFFFGTEDPKVEMFSGTLDLSEYLAQQGHQLSPSQPASPLPAPCEAGQAALASDTQRSAEIIPEGQRNSTLYQRAVVLLKRYGYNEGTWQAYCAEAEKCVPPLAQSEIEQIWASAYKFYAEQIVTQPDYIPPSVYNNASTQASVIVDSPISNGGQANPPDGNATNAQKPPRMQYKPKDFTDVGQALVLQRECKNTVIRSA